MHLAACSAGAAYSNAALRAGIDLAEKIKRKNKYNSPHNPVSFGRPKYYFSAGFFPVCREK
jgi:hypothetical protein